MAGAIIKGSDHFFVTTYEGNGGGQRVGKFVPFTDNGTIAKSCMFDRASTGSLIRTPSSDGNKGVFTISLWYKPTSADNGLLFWASGSDDAWNSSSSAGLYVESDTIRFYSSGTIIFATNRTFEDTSKFYHILVANDSSQSGTDKIKLYVDGDQITSFATDNRSSIPTNSIINTQIKHNIGGQTTTGTANAFIDAYLAEVNFVDGSALTPSTFGLTDTSTGRWIPKSLTGITYGTNGIRMQFANSAGQTIGDDTSGQGNDYAVSNLATTDVTLDTPTDLYPTLVDFQTSYAGNYSEGNLRIDGSTNSQTSVGRSTLTFDAEDSTGYYWEVKNIENNGFGQNWNGYGMFGVDADNSTPSSGNLKPASGSYVTYRESGNIVLKLGGLSEFDGGTAYFPKTGNNSSLPSGGDTIGVAVKGGKVAV